MASPEKTVFISYRRKDIPWALAVYQNLTAHGYDVFFDYKSIHSGDFEQIILGNIMARAHFLVLLTPTALDRCSEPGDWLRREIETAIDERRNIVPMFFEGFNFSAPSVSKKMTGKLARLNKYNGLDVPLGYFDEAMERLRDKFLNVTLDAVIQPVSDEVQKAVIEQQVAADQAILRGEELKEIEEEKAKRQREEKEHQTATRRAKREKERQERKDAWGSKMQTVSSWLSGTSTVGRTRIPVSNLILLAISGFAILILSGFLIARNYFLPGSPGANLPPGTSPPLLTPVETSATDPAVTSANTPPPSEPPPPTHTLTPVAGSTLVADRDGMTMVFVPAGEFQMGSHAGEPDERPVRTVFVDAFWIDQTEVTNSMYARCVNDGECRPPDSNQSSTRENYFGNPEFEGYPVIFVSWDAANAYCEWAGRRLPTEAEWEKAAGWDESKRAQRLYPWGDASFDGSKANFCDVNCKRDSKNTQFEDGFADTAPAGSYPAGASFYGALDMAGNVWEWVEDWYDVYPGGDRNASNDFGQVHRVVRGGSWFFPFPETFRAANRAPNHPGQPNNAIGFRCALSVSE